MTASAATTRPRAPAARAFTLVEVLATLTLASIVMPAVVEGIQLSLATADHARRQSEAASLAQTKLEELVATNQIYDAEMSGDFGEDWPAYLWMAQAQDWPEDARLREIKLTVLWISRGRERRVVLSTLAYSGGAQ